MKELGKLLDSLNVLKSIEILDNFLINLYHQKSKVEIGKINMNSYKTFREICSKIYFFETNKEMLFNQIKIIQQDTPSCSVPLYLTSYRVFCSTS